MTPFLKPLAACAALLPLSVIASPTWTTCTLPHGVDEAAILDGRIGCTTLTVPVDHDDPDAGQMQVGLVRVRAAADNERRGAIFFDFGGPGIDPTELLVRTAAFWASSPPDDADDGDKRRLSETYDLVAVIPRGLRAGTAVSCTPMTLPEPDSFVERQDDARWNHAVTWAAAYASACASHPLAPYINTYQHASDIEQARRWLGEPRLHFVGSSYGTRVGATYASLFPDTVGRFVFDSSMGLFDTFATANARTRHELDYAVLRDAIAPALADPARWRLGTDRQALERTLRQLPSALKARWVPYMTSPASIVAAIRLAPHLGSHTEATGLHDWIASQVFHDDPASQTMIVEQAHLLLDMYFDDSAEPDTPDFDAVNLMTICNDTGWGNSPSAWREQADRYREAHVAWTGQDIAQALVCGQWKIAPRPARWTSAATPTAPILMIHAQHDVATPLTGASHAADAMPGAKLVVARGMRGHVIHGVSRTPCVERAVGRYLLDGELPPEKHSSCDVVNREVTP